MGERAFAQADGARAAGVIPLGHALGEIELAARRAHRIQDRQRVGFGVEGVHAPGRAIPMARSGAARAHARGHRGLADGGVVDVAGADLEQCQIGKAAVGVASGGGDQVGQDRRPHVVELVADRVGEAERRIGAAEQLGLGGRGEGPGHRLDHAARGQRPLGPADPPLARGEHRAGKGGRPRQGHRRHPVVAVDPDDLLDQVGLAVDIGPPGRHRGGDRAVALPDREAQRLEDAAAFACRHLDAAQAGDALRAQGNLTPPLRLLAGDDDLALLAAAELADQAGGDRRSPDGGGGIHAALEPVPGVAVDLEPASGGGGAHRVEQRDLEEQIDRRLGAAGCLSAHDAADAVDGLRVRDHHHVGLELVGPAVERRDLLAGSSEAHHQVTGKLVGVEHVERSAEIVSHQIGDVDQRGNRPQADRLEAVLEPAWTGAVLDPPEAASDHHRAGAAGPGRKIAAPFDRALEGPLDGPCLEGF